MKVVKYRFFRKGIEGPYIAEKITWALVTTEGIDRNDLRAAPIGQPENIGNEVVDLWVPLVISNPGFDTNLIDHTYNTEPKFMENDIGQLVQTSVKTSIISFTQMDVYSKPLLPNYTEITMAEYNDGCAMYAASLPV